MLPKYDNFCFATNDSSQLMGVINCSNWIALVTLAAHGIHRILLQQHISDI